MAQSSSSRLLIIRDQFPSMLLILIPLGIFYILLHTLLFPRQLYDLISPLTSENDKMASCDYSQGKWIPDLTSPLYNDSCSVINHLNLCITNGRPDTDYVYWRWKPDDCHLPRFDPEKVLRLLANKHIGFAGDSLAENQLESLICMLSIASTPVVIPRSGDPNLLKTWFFASHNVTAFYVRSVWLVEGEDVFYYSTNKLYLDKVDQRWASASFDILVLNAGQWFFQPAMYYDGGDDSVVGCNQCSGNNYTELGFHNAYRRTVRASLAAIKLGARSDKEIQVIMATFSPSHFNRPREQNGECPLKKPYKEGEYDIDSNSKIMRQIVLEEIETTRSNPETKIIIDTLDVTYLSGLRPDGHPGPYRLPPSATGARGMDCLHWCMPGVIDTWNEILVAIIKRRQKYKV